MPGPYERLALGCCCYEVLLGGLCQRVEESTDKGATTWLVKQTLQSLSVTFPMSPWPESSLSRRWIDLLTR